MDHREGKGPKKDRAVPDRRANRTVLIRTLILLAVFGVIVFVPLFGKLYAIQIGKNDEYEQKAIDQQTRDNAVAANRGQITDANGNVLAMSATVYDVILSPRDFKALQEDWDKKNGEKPADAQYERPEAEQVANDLAAILGTDAAGILARFAKDSAYQVIATQTEKDVSDQIRQLILDDHLSNSVYLTPTSKRYYPYGTLASQVVGWVNYSNDGKGAYGMEAMYEDELAGQMGRVVTAKKGDGTEMKYSFQDYYDATDGNDLALTLDTNIQSYCERILEKGIELYDVQNGGFAIAMDPKTGAIKAWANSPGYDLNSPRTISDPVLNAYIEAVKADPSSNEKAYNKALSDMQNKQWRNKAINDTYEPGSTFKSVVLAAALEEGAVDENSTFDCPGYAIVADRRISCSKKAPGHGHQTLALAVANSCNPAFIAIGQKLGAVKFYDYLEAFGFLEATGIDMQGEPQSSPVPNLIWSRDKFTSANGITNLATASFGQGLQVTPIQLITAASAVINGGHLMEPYVMQSITDADGNVVKENSATEVRQVVSEETSQRCRTILEGVVDGGTGKQAYVPGYRIGGKTGSSETLESRQGIDHTIVSFLGFAPADDPQIVILLCYDNPKPAFSGATTTASGVYISGGNMAAPMAGELLSSILDYMGVEKHYSEDERAFIDVTVPGVVGQSAEVASGTITGAGFTVRTVGDGDAVTAQIPAGGAAIPNGSQVVLYMGAEPPTDQVTVPDLRGQTAAQAQQSLQQYGLYFKANGSTKNLNTAATVVSQSFDIGASVDRGTVVECTFSDSSAVD